MDDQLQQHLDVVNSKVCPFCHRALIEQERGLDGSTACRYYTCTDHLSVGYIGSEWHVIRISPRGFDRLTFRFWRTDPKCLIQTDAITNRFIMGIPPFPLFQYSLGELANKIKTYVVFS